MAFTASDRTMLEGYIKKARPFEEMFSVKGKTAIVTGGSSGIGQACAIDLAKHGAYVIINYSGHKEGAQETLDAVLKAGK